MNILITGVTGYIGRNLVTHLAKERADYKLFAVGRPSTDVSASSHLFSDYFADAGDVEALAAWMQRCEIEVVVHLASLYLKSHRSNQINDLIASNLGFGCRLLEASVKSQVKVFINTGTFWQHYQNAEYSPVNLYAATKQAFEALARYYIEADSLYFVTLSLSDTFGPGDERRKILNIWRDADPTETMPMSGGEQKMDILYIDDVLSAYTTMIEATCSDYQKRELADKTFAVHSKKVLTLRELYAAFEHVSGKRLDIAWGAIPYARREVMTPWTKTLSLPGWQPNFDIEQGLRAFLKMRTSHD